MCGSSGGGGGSTQYNWNDVMAPKWADQLSYGQSLRDRPYQAYQGQQVADLSPDQQAALQNGTLYLTDPTLGVQNGAPTVNAAMNQAKGTLQGDYLNGGGFNPYATTMNPYMGEGPAFQDVLKNSNDEITRAYQNGTAADTTKMFNLAGVYGGSANQNAVTNNQLALGKTLANNTANMENQQYNQSANLYQQAIQQANQDYENERQRQTGTIGLGQNQNNVDLSNIQALMGLGGTQNTYQQNLLNNAYQNWLTAQNYPYAQSQYYSGLLSQAQGGTGNILSQQSSYGPGLAGSLAGAGLLAYGLSQ